MNARTYTAPALKIAALDSAAVAYGELPVTLAHRVTHATIESVAASARARGLDQLWLHPSWHPTPAAPELWRETSLGMRLDPRQPAHWTHATRPGMYGLSAIVSVACDANHVWNAAPDARTLIDAVTLYAARVGQPYAYSPGATGTRLLRSLHNASGHATAIDLPAPLPDCAHEPSIECPIHWMRHLTPDERGAKYLHSYDKNGAWLAACSSLALGYGAPDHVIPPNMTLEDCRLPGYFRIHLSDRWHPVPSARLPLPPILPRPRRGSSLVWVTQPTLSLLREAGADYGITEAWVWRQHHRPLEPWYKRLRDARASLMVEDTAAARLALSAVKATYTHSLGRLGTPGRDGGLVGTDLYRPDWMQANRALANANMQRQLWKIVREGVYPLAVGGQDTLYIVSDEPDPIAAAPASLRMGTGLGQWKIKDGAVPLADVLAELERGRRDADEWRGGLARLQSWLKHRNDGAGE